MGLCHADYRVCHILGDGFAGGGVLSRLIYLAFHGLAFGQLKVRNKWLYMVHYSLARGLENIVSITSRSLQQLDDTYLGIRMICILECLEI